MKFSIYGVTVIILTLSSIILRILPLGDISLWATRITTPLLMLMITIMGFMIYKKLVQRGNLKEASKWPLMTIGGFLPFFGFIAHIVADLIPQQLSNFAIVGNFLLTVAYIILIIALWRLSTVFDAKVKLNIWIPVVICLITLIFSLYLLFVYGSVEVFIKIGFTLFILMDFISIMFCYVLYKRTRGGALSLPFALIAIGIILMTAYQLVAIILESLKIMTFHHPLLILMIVALAIWSLGFDLRYTIELHLSNQ